MSANVVHPAELERQLQSRFHAARERQAIRRPKTHRSRRGRRTATSLLAATSLALLAAAAWASHGGSIIDLTADDMVVEHNDAIFTQGGFGSGTGNFDPFLTLQPGGNVDTEFGFNLCSEPVFGFDSASIACPSPNMENQGGDRTHELRASSVPAIDVGGTLYREFFLDSNDTGADPWMSIQVIRIFLDEQPDLTYNPVTNAFTGNSGTAPSLLWDLDGDGDQTILTNTQGLESGSGVSDMSILIPDSLFPANCFYGSTTCNLFIYFGTIAGDPNLAVAGHEGKNWNTTAGFEEWSTELLPVVNVAKTVDIAFDRTYPWDVQKEADGEPDVIHVFAGDTATINWTVTATVGTPVDTDASITGDIVITNPTGGAIPEIEAIVEDVEDVLTLGAATIDATVTCPDAFPFSIDGGDSVTCTYSHAPSSTDDGTNEATVTLGLYDKNELIDTIEYSDTEDVIFADANVTEIDECVEVTDDNATPGNTGDDELLDAELCANESPGVYPDSNTVGPFTTETCSSTTVTNTAYTETNDTGTIDSDPDSVSVNCYELTVTKDAETAFGRDYDWEIAKTRFIAPGELDGDLDPLTLTLDEGQVYTANYEITVTMTGFTDDDHAVSGEITITNPAPMIAEDVEVTDVISHAVDSDIAATVDCGGGLAVTDVPAAAGGTDGEATCTYSADLPNGDDRLNTATATLFSIGYEGTAAVTFDANAPNEEIDECIDITDDAGTVDPTDDIEDTVCVTDLDANDQWTKEYTLDIGPFAVCGEYTFTNTVSFETTDDDNDTDESGSATYTVTIDVPCPEGCTLTQGYWKTHNDSFWGGAPTDETWDLIGPLAEREIFFLSGMTYFDVMWTAPQGNVYFNLAHQYIAAELNMLDGADGSAITTAFSAATVLFETYTDEQVAAFKGKTGKEIRAQFIALAGTLGSYNEGLIGPGHCDEDATSSQLSGHLPIADRRGSRSMG